MCLFLITAGLSLLVTLVIPKATGKDAHPLSVSFAFRVGSRPTAIFDHVNFAEFMIHCSRDLCGISNGSF